MTSDYASLIAAGTVRIQRLLPGPIERVWTYLTEPARRGRWLAGGAMELRVGGNVELLFRHAELSDEAGAAPARHAHMEPRGHLNAGRITACDPPRLLAYTWGENHGDPSEVRFDLEPRDDKVLLTVTHRRLDGRDNLRSVAGGWHTHLDILADRLHGRAPPNFWRSYERLAGEYATRFVDMPSPADSASRERIDRTPARIIDDPTAGDRTTMRIQYLEIVTRDVDAVCAAYASACDVQFGDPDAGLGNARTAALAGGGMVGVRAPLRATEEPVVRPYWLVQDIEAAVAAVVEAGGEVAVPPMDIPGHGRFAIYLEGGNDHGLWQL